MNVKLVKVAHKLKAVLNIKSKFFKIILVYKRARIRWLANPNG